MTHSKQVRGASSKNVARDKPLSAADYRSFSPEFPCELAQRRHCKTR